MQHKDMEIYSISLLNQPEDNHGNDNNTDNCIKRNLRGSPSGLIRCVKINERLRKQSSKDVDKDYNADNPL